jgi:hypothetical protein
VSTLDEQVLLLLQRRYLSAEGGDMFPKVIYLSAQIQLGRFRSVRIKVIR